MGPRCHTQNPLYPEVEPISQENQQSSGKMQSYKTNSFEVPASETFSVRSPLEYGPVRILNLGSSPTLATCETSQVLLAGVSGGFARGYPVFAPPTDWPVSYELKKS